ncbi:MAG: methyltransferase domain-containing protein [Clostridia bacterium]
MTDKFICPLCKKPLILNGKNLVCENNHSYDRAKQGYYHLLLANQKNSKIPGDNKQMVDSRRDFLNQGFYQKFQKALCETIKNYTDNINFILDAGCGEGYYTNSIKTCFPNSEIVAFDISKFAVKSASGTYKNINFAVASSFEIPVKSESFDVLINIFSPMVENEFARVLKKDGIFIFAVPGKKHLYELKEILYKNPYENEEKDTDYNGFKFLERVSVTDEIEIKDNKTIWNLFSMTPYYWKTGKNGSEKLKEVNYLKTKIHFDFLVYKKM